MLTEIKVFEKKVIEVKLNEKEITEKEFFSVYEKENNFKTNKEGIIINNVEYTLNNVFLTGLKDDIKTYLKYKYSTKFYNLNYKNFEDMVTFLKRFKEKINRFNKQKICIFYEI